MLLHAPAKRPECSKLPTAYELGACFQLDDTHCLLVRNLAEGRNDEGKKPEMAA